MYMYVKNYHKCTSILSNITIIASGNIILRIIMNYLESETVMNQIKTKKIYRIVSILIILVNLCFPYYDAYAKKNVNVVVSEEKQTDSDAIEEVHTDTDAVIEVYDEKKALVKVSLIYSDKSNSEIIKSGYGFFVGDPANDVYLITTCGNVTLTNEEINDIAQRYEVKPEDVKGQVVVWLKNDITVNANIIQDSSNMDIAILNLESSLSGCTTLRICEDSNINSNGQKIYSYMYEALSTSSDAEIEGRKVVGEIQDWTDINSAHYYQYTMADCPTAGLPLFNEKGEVIGINTSLINSNDVHYTSLQITEVTEVMDIMGLMYNPEIILDTVKLDEILQEYNELNKDKYTEDSWKKVEDCYLELSEIKEDISEGNIDYSTQSKIDKSVNEMRQSIDSLKEAEVAVSTVITIAIVIGVVLFIIIVVLIIVILVNKHKFKKKMQAEAESKQTAEEVLKMSGRITPGSIQNTINNSPMNRSLNGIKDVNDNSSFETTVLSNDNVLINDNQQIGFAVKNEQYPMLIRLKTGESVIINKNTFIVGKSAELVDYCIRYNNNISRKHACIARFNDGYYIQDLNTTNGTCVNNVPIMKEQYVKLTNKCIIKMGEEEFEFTF